MSWHTLILDETCFNRESLVQVLNLATETYGRHTDWFLRHRETALRQLAVLLTAELVVAKFLNELHVPGYLPIIIFAGFVFLSVLLAQAGTKNCRRAFKAAMENAMLVNKILWAMAPSGRVFVKEEFIKKRLIPVSSEG